MTTSGEMSNSVNSKEQTPQERLTDKLQTFDLYGVPRSSSHQKDTTKRLIVYFNV